MTVMSLWERARKLAGENVGLAVSLCLTVVVVLRALYFAGFDITVALSVLAFTNQATLLISTLALVLIAGVSLAWIFDPGGIINRAHDASAPWAIVFWTTIAVTALLPLVYASSMSPLLIAATTIGLLIIILFRIRAARRKKPRSAKASNRLAWFAGVVCGTVGVFLLSQPWMASEQLIIRSSAKPVVGYVVGEQAGQLFMLDRNKAPVWVKSSDVRERYVCTINPVPDELRWLTTPINKMARAEIADCAD